MGTEDNAYNFYLDPMAASSARNLSKKPTWEISVDSPPKKKSGSLEDYVRELSETVATRSQKCGDREQEELDRAMQLKKKMVLRRGLSYTVRHYIYVRMQCIGGPSQR
uniref:Uncharacterized protein n=1 Tax=Setaria italica TaxID=4555 RepID=K3ZAZ7_SETIT